MRLVRKWALCRRHWNPQKYDFFLLMIRGNEFLLRSIINLCSKRLFKKNWNNIKLNLMNIYSRNLYIWIHKFELKCFQQFTFIFMPSTESTSESCSKYLISSSWVVTPSALFSASIDKKTIAILFFFSPFCTMSLKKAKTKQKTQKIYEYGNQNGFYLF